MKAEGVSIILCCHNSEPRLKPTLQHLEMQHTTANIPWEIILVDNASTDQTAHLAKSVWQQNDCPINFKVVFEPNLGLMNARIRGLKCASFTYICYIDDDNWLDVNYVDEVYDIFKSNPEVAACGGKSEAVFESGLQLPSWFHKYQHAYAIGTQAETEGFVPDSRGYLWGAGISFRKSALIQLLNSGFRPLLTGRSGKLLSAGEDAELCFALRACGWKLWYSPRLKLRHFIPSFKIDWNYLLKMYKGFGASQVFLDAYLLFFEKRKPTKSMSWFNYFRKALTKIFKMRVKHILAAFLNPKPGNNKDRVGYYRFGSLIQILKMPPWSYKKMHKEIFKTLEQAMLIKQKNYNK